jgi:glycosyltransferase involved in cell wall biosynthesis
LIERCQGGIVVPPRDPGRLISAILYLFDNRKIAENMGKSGRDLVKNEFSYKSVKEKLVQLIYEL